MKKKYEIVVIGGGPAGITLAKKLGKKFKMAIIRPEDYSMIYCAMPYVIENLIEKQKCFKKDELVTDAGAELIRDLVVSINFENKNLELSKQGKLYYDKVIIATGANPLIPKIEGSHLQGVMGFKTQIDLEILNSYVEKGLKKIIVVGAGAIGIELAQAMKNKGLDVFLIDMAPRVLPNLVDTGFSKNAENLLTENSINLILNAKVQKLNGNDFVNEVYLDNGDIINLNNHSNSEIQGIIVFATGVTPELSLIPKSNLKIGHQGIIVNEKMETNIPDVYAVGDCVEFKSFITEKITSGKLATNAVPMARILAKNLLGQNAAYKGFINGAATKIYDKYFGGTGLTVENALAEGFEILTGYSKLSTKFPIMPNTQPLELNLVVDKKNKKIIGGQAFSGEPVATIIDLISFAIQMRASIYDLEEISYSAQPYQSFFPAGNIFVQAAEKIITKLENE